MSGQQTPTSDKTRLELLRERIEIKKKQLYLREGLPHLHGWKWYSWAREFFESQNKKNLLVAANQISKSSSQIRKCIHWATEVDLWPELWAKTPSQFWYFYPTDAQVEIEFEEKWKLFLPRGDFKADKKYGWDIEKKDGKIFAIHFKSGVSVYFKTYSKKVSALQSSTVDALFCDEELPISYLDELMFRLVASNGYFHMVFTATLGQDFWRLCMDPGSGEPENWPGAHKQVVSMYDCLYYDDYTPSFWTTERIKEVEDACKDEHEVARRVHGKFIMSKEGLLYPAFDIKVHMKEKHPLPSSWSIYTGVDIGSGGKNHPAAMVFVGVSPDYTKGRVFLAWRGDSATTTAGDILEKYKELKYKNKLKPVLEQYDWENADFGTLAARAGEPFVKAEKSHAIGEGILSTLFKKNMLEIYHSEETAKLGVELMNLRSGVNKRKSKDDLVDALRYAVAKIPWNFDAVIRDEARLISMETQKTDAEIMDLNRRGLDDDEEAEHKRQQRELDEEFELYNDLYG